ncbi:MAG: MoxR family ATPase [Acidobacteriota bacterium]
MHFKVDEAQRLVARLGDNIATGIVGQRDLVEGLLLALVANGHALIEGVPGLAKTRSVNLLARACQGSFQRVQFTPDLLPADIVGTEIYNQATASFETKTGPLFANFVLADEINRAAPKVQSALLEAMQERQVTLGDKTYPLPRPFFVFATQNPVEQEGTYPLPEAQVDRFLMKLVVRHPSRDDEQKIVRMVMSETELPQVKQLVDSADILGLQDAAREIFVEDRIIDYATSLVDATRNSERYGLDLDAMIQLGASPRASIALVQIARARALMDGRDAVLPDDVKASAPDVLRHRILMTYHADAEGITSEQVVAQILGAVKVP